MKHIKLFKENTLYKVNNDLIEHIMDSVTGDQYMEEMAPGDMRFYNYHANICDAHFPSQDWCWEEALEHWSADMVIEAIDAYFDYCEDFYDSCDDEGNLINECDFIPETA